MRTFVLKEPFVGRVITYNEDKINIELLKSGRIPHQDMIDTYLGDVIETAQTIIDIGSGIGVRTLAFIKKNPSVNVYCFEPCSSLFNILMENLEINNVSNTVLMNNCLGHFVGTVRRAFEKRGKIEDFKDMMHIGNGSILSDTESAHFVRLDSLSLLSCDMIYIDLPYILDGIVIGGIKTIEKFHPVIVDVGSGNVVKGNGPPSFMLSIPLKGSDALKQLGYTCIELRGDGDVKMYIYVHQGGKGKKYDGGHDEDGSGGS